MRDGMSAEGCGLGLGRGDERAGGDARVLCDPVDEHGQVGEAHRVALGAACRGAEAGSADLGGLVGSVVDDQRATAVTLQRPQ